jgi:hypothetical protein
MTSFGQDPFVSGGSRPVNKTVSRAEALGLPGESEEKEVVPEPKKEKKAAKPKPKTRVGPKRSGKTPKGKTPKVVQVPEWAREKAVVDALSVKDKKQFLSLHNDGAPYSTFSSYLGKSRGVFDYMTTHAEAIQKEITNLERAKDEKRRLAQIEAAQLNHQSQKTGVLQNTVEPPVPAKKRRKRWEVAPEKQRWLVQEAGHRSIKYLTEKYHGGYGPEAEAEVAYEVERLEKALAEFQRKQKANK